ncbi:glycosyltransferase, partial [Staphylococcus epidermidis]|uniref:glycosyltransferase n=1 Tax=Staphylococcus epidermidis TaxID=1282 RepID=UPI0028CBA8A9
THTLLAPPPSNPIYQFLSLRIPILLIPLPLHQSRQHQIHNPKNFQSNPYPRHIPQDQLTQVNLFQQLNHIQLHRQSIIK